MRLGRTTGYSWRGRAAALSGMGAVAIAMVMALSPAAAATGAGIVIHAKYHGAVSPSNYISTSGCGKVTVAKAWNFKMKTGIGGAANAGKAVACAKSVSGVGTSGSANAGGSFEVAIPLKIPSAASSVAVNAAYKVAATMKATDGIASTANPTCNAPTYSYSDYGNFYEWGYSGFSFAYYNESYGYSSSSGYSYNYTYSNAAIPSPFNLNNTSYEDVYVSYGASSSCYAEAQMFLYTYSSLVDETTGAGMAQTGNTLGTVPYGTYSYLADTFIEVYNQTSWSCYGSFYWYGPSNYSYSSPFACHSYNTTLTSVQYTYYPTFTSTTGTNNTLTWGGSMTGTGTMWWNDSFSGTDHYTLFMTVYSSMFAYNTWKHGSGSWAFNMATLGNGFNLKSIVIT